MRATRLISILTSLRARGRLTAAQLAEEHQVSLRTIYRDVDQLTLAGLPGPVAELGLGAVMASAEQKLAVALPAALRQSAERARNRFHLDAPTWFSERDRPGHLAAIADAVWNCRRLQMRYLSWKREKTLQTEPLGIVLKGGAWYLISRTDTMVRTYRVSRVKELRETGDAFDRPEGLDLADYWCLSTDRLEHATIAEPAQPSRHRKLRSSRFHPDCPAMQETARTRC